MEFGQNLLFFTATIILAPLLKYEEYSNLFFQAYLFCQIKL